MRDKRRKRAKENVKIVFGYGFEAERRDFLKFIIFDSIFGGEGWRVKSFLK